MQEWEPVLQELADTSDDFSREGGEILLVRHGRDHTLSLKTVSGVGLAIKANDGSYEHVAKYIQRNLLELPRLASQIQKALDREQTKRPVKFVQGPADFEHGRDRAHWQSAYAGVGEYLSEGEPDTTRIVQLMAAAGKGKTVLIENVAISFARKYAPEPYPVPIMLPIDLLGRYTGNISDAIAGSLNNTYLFPNLTQRDVILCMKKRWIILALDGFDELVARIGVRDAFLGISDLIDQLDGNGDIVLSARESFFDLYQITAGIRTYLQTRRGSYSTSIIRLSPWDEKQGTEVFSGLGSRDPSADLSGLNTAFEDDREVVFHPFFLTRLAALWLKGERFEKATGQRDTLSRSRYVIETFLQRETYEKWKDREGNPLLTDEGHREMLGSVAEEMWRSGAFTFDADELRIAAEIGLGDGGFGRQTISDALDRVTTHAAVQATTRGFAFVHDRFLHYFLGYRIQKWLRAGAESIIEVLSARELPPSVVEWTNYWLDRDEAEAGKIAEFLNGLVQKYPDGTGSENIGYLLVQVLNGVKPNGQILVSKQILVGESLAHTVLTNIEFRDCRFWNVDIDDTLMTQCLFANCQFGDVRISRKCILKNVIFRDSSFSALEIEGQGSYFSPEEIADRLSTLGAEVIVPVSARLPQKMPAVRADVAELIERSVKASERTCDVALEEISADNKLINFVIRAGEEIGVLREIAKDVSGPKKRFVRFSVDRNKLLRAKREPTGDQRIDNFWNTLREKYGA